MSQVGRTGDGGEAHEGLGNEARAHHQAKVESWQQQSEGHANLAPRGTDLAPDER